MKKQYNQKCWYCKIFEAELKCLYCTRCRLAMAEGKISPNYIQGRKCADCGKEINNDSLSNVVCDNCIKEI